MANTGLVNEQCSIDALLERTIKHMVFLQSVTKHADKLKQTEESKVRGILSIFWLCLCHYFGVLIAVNAQKIK